MRESTEHLAVGVVPGAGIEPAQRLSSEGF